ncbi:hypothetical protein EG68_04077 [Paragonimus skrjabini miyazakii]|uniref:Uncharacterized protein n=1 Tax=Paragonimus skrjabini miyazakii TaxID=59628 RepID=A0A8S9YZ98_9TREM|nr:hypothetical protein EG68_04077 [Paragonimus skrjabini miyazakii]
MPGPKSKEKFKQPETNEAVQKLSLLFDIISQEECTELCKHIHNDELLRNCLQNIIQSRALSFEKPTRKFVEYTQRHLSITESGGAELPITSKPTDRFELKCTPLLQLEPHTDLWDAALLDYLMEAIYWATNEWCLGDQVSHFIDPLLYTQDNSKRSAYNVCVALVTIYLLLRHMQLWQKAFPNLTECVRIKNDVTQQSVTGVVSSIKFLKALFQTKCPFQTNEQQNFSLSELSQFRIKYCGALTGLENNAAIMLVDFCTKHFLHVYRLVEQLFGPRTGFRQKMVEQPCELEIDTLLKHFGCTNSTWPPPLAEAVPLSLVANHVDLFEDCVTQWLFRHPSPATVDKEEVRVETPPQSVESEHVSPEPDSLEKYLSLLDNLTVTELKAIAHLSNAEAEETVKDLLVEIDHTASGTPEELRTKLKDSQLRLANLLIHTAQQIIIEAETIVSVQS